MLIIVAALALQTQAAQIPVMWSGEWSKIRKPQITLACTAYDWTATWLRHLGKIEDLNTLELDAKHYPETRSRQRFPFEAIPTADFDHNVAFMVFGGDIEDAFGFSLIDCKT